MAMIALRLSTAPLVAGPLLQNASELIELVSVKPWSGCRFGAQRPHTMDRQRSGLEAFTSFAPNGSASMAVCAGRWVMRLIAKRAVCGA
jgi:hypothetical protein